MIIIAGNSNIKLASTIANYLELPFVVANTEKFADQELKVQISANLSAKKVIIVQSTSKPANDNLMELLLIANAAKLANAKRIYAVIPYFGYSRQDRITNYNTPISINLIANLLQAANIDFIITIDLHNKKSKKFFNNKIINLNPWPLFINNLKIKNKRNIQDYVIIAADYGSLSRAKLCANILGTQFAVINKKREDNSYCTVTNLTGTINNKHCILIDDIIDSGNTIASAAAYLWSNKAKSITACITHAVLSEAFLNNLSDANIDNIYITNTIEKSVIINNIKQYNFVIICIGEIIAKTVNLKF